MAPKSNPLPGSRKSSTSSTPENDPSSLFPEGLDTANLFSLQFNSGVNGGTTANNKYALPMSAYSTQTTVAPNSTMNAPRAAYTAFTPFLPSATSSQHGQQLGQQTQYMPTYHLHTVHPDAQPLVTSPTTLSPLHTTNAHISPTLKRKSTTDLSPGVNLSDVESPDWESANTGNHTSEPLTVSIAAASSESGAGKDSGGGSKRTKTQRACDPCRRKKIR